MRGPLGYIYSKLYDHELREIPERCKNVRETLEAQAVSRFVQSASIGAAAVCSLSSPLFEVASIQKNQTVGNKLGELSFDLVAHSPNIAVAGLAVATAIELQFVYKGAVMRGNQLAEEA